jgi:tetrathionate reductase subunit C
MNATVVQIVTSASEASWLPWAVQYFLLIGISVAAFALSIPGIVLRYSEWRGISRRALLAALICGLSAPVALLADLHQPGRFLHFYLYPNASSWMAWGAFFIPLYLFSLLLYAWLALRPTLAARAGEGGAGAVWYARLAYGGHESRGAVAIAAVLAASGGIAVLVYTGMETMVVRARPIWHTPILPVVLAATAFTGASGVIHLLNRLLAPATPYETRRLNRVLAASLLLTAGAALTWLAIALSGASSSHTEALAQVLDANAWRVFLVSAAVAVVAALWLAIAFPQRGILVGSLALLIAWLTRWTLLMGGQGLSKIGQSYEGFALPVGPDGVLGIIGTIGLCVVFYVALVSLLPWGDRASSMKGA